MKNYEKYDINSLGINRCDYMYKKIFEKKCDCDGLECVDCPLESLEKFYKWSQEEYIEPPKLSHDEYVILKSANPYYEKIGRNYSGELYFEGHGTYSFVQPFNYLFKFTKFENDDYEIAKLIEDYEKEHGDGN